MTLHPPSLLEAFPVVASAFSRVLAWAHQPAPLQALPSGFESGANAHLSEQGWLLVQGFLDACFETELAAKQRQERVNGSLIECVFAKTSA